MIGSLSALLAVAQQTDAVAAQLGRIASLMTWLVVAAVVVGLLSAITLVMSFFTMRSASKLMEDIDAQLARLAPRTEPLLEKLTRLTDDVRGVTDAVRRRVNDLMDTISDVNDALRKAHRAADTRVREFTAVLDVVQAEAEEVLLDGAATARGLHATAEALRGSAPRRDRQAGGGHGIPRHAMDAHAADVEYPTDDHQEAPQSSEDAEPAEPPAGSVVTSHARRHPVRESGDD